MEMSTRADVTTGHGGLSDHPRVGRRRRNHRGSVQHLTVESKSLLIGDEAAEALTEYAALLAKHGTGDRIKLRAFGSDGDEVTATIVLSAGTTILTETSHNSLPEPENGDAVGYTDHDSVISAIRRFRHRHAESWPHRAWPSTGSLSCT